MDHNSHIDKHTPNYTYIYTPYIGSITIHYTKYSPNHAPNLTLTMPLISP